MKSFTRQIPVFIFLILIGLLVGLNYEKGRQKINSQEPEASSQSDSENYDDLVESVLPSEGFSLPIEWGEIGPSLTDIGVIDKDAFVKAMNLPSDQQDILNQNTDQLITINNKNSRFVVNVLWALGLAQKSKVYDEGPFGTDYKDRVGNFASTGGWSLAKSDAVNYLNNYDLISLADADQNRVSEIAKNIYRPCCGNSTWFPDCNHGMAALGAIELMVSAGLPDQEIYDNILKLNSFWFPETYLSIATYFEQQGTNWKDVDAKLVLGQKYSSAQGAQEVYNEVGPLPESIYSSGSCGA